MAGKKPTAAVVLSLIGGILILIGGIVTLAYAGLATGVASGLGGILALGAVVVGAIGVVFGVVIMALAMMLNKQPGRHVTLGVVILVLSILSVFGGDGFLIGLILGLVGGILAIVWKG